MLLLRRSAYGLGLRVSLLRHLLPGFVYVSYVSNWGVSISLVVAFYGIHFLVSFPVIPCLDEPAPRALQACLRVSMKVTLYAFELKV